MRNLPTFRGHRDAVVNAQRQIDRNRRTQGFVDGYHGRTPRRADNATYMAAWRRGREAREQRGGDDA